MPGLNRTTVSLTLFLSLLLADPTFAVTKILGVGDLMIVRDAEGKQYGAVRVANIDQKEKTLVYQWFLAPPGEVNLAAEGVSDGTVEVRQVKGRAAVAFGPFVLEWHGGEGETGVFSANGNLGINPLMVASSGIKDPARIRDARAGFKYEIASTREVPDPLGLQDTFAALPKARVGFSVEDAQVVFADGIEEPAVRIVRIDTDSTAFEAGIRKDQTILAFNGVVVLNSEDFHQLLSGVNPGDPVSLTVLTPDKREEQVSFLAESRLTKPTLSEPSEPDPALSEQQREDLKQTEEVKRVMQQALEALRAVHYD